MESHNTADAGRARTHDLGLIRPHDAAAQCTIVFRRVSYCRGEIAFSTAARRSREADLASCSITRVISGSPHPYSTCATIWQF